MTRFEDTFDAYQSRSYPLDGYFSSMFYEELKQCYQKNKAEIFDYYEPRALAETLAGINTDKVTINDFDLYFWKLEIKTSRMALEIFSEGRPDIFFVKYAAEVRPQVGIRMPPNMYDYTNQQQFADEISKLLEHEINEILKTLPIPSEVYNCKTCLKADFVNMGLVLWAETGIMVKQIPSLDNVKFMEYTIPRIIYDSVTEIGNKLGRL